MYALLLSTRRGICVYINVYSLLEWKIIKRLNKFKINSDPRWEMSYCTNLNVLN